MNKTGKRIFVLVSLLIFLSFLTTGFVNAEQTKHVVQVTEPLELELWYPKNPAVNDYVSFDLWIDSHGETVTLNIVELTITNGIDTLTLYNNTSPIYLDSINPVFYEWTEIQFNITEIWDITLYVETDTGDPYYEYGQLEVSPFRLDLYHDYEAFVNNPTKYNIEVQYEDNIPNKDISIEILLDDSNIYPRMNDSIYSTSHTFTTGPNTYTTSFYHTFGNTGSHILWLNVTDLNTEKQWFTSDWEYPEWINVTLQSDYELFVGNTTKIEIELTSYHSSTIDIEATFTIEKENGYSYPEIMYLDVWQISLTSTIPFTDSISWSFSEHGNYYIRLEVEDDANDKYAYESNWMEVYNEVDLRIYQPYEIWAGDEYWADFDIRYFKSQPVTADIEFYIDDGTSTTSLRTETVTFDGDPYYPFDSDNWYGHNSTIIYQMGYFDAWLQVYIQETGETFTEHCWFYVRGDDTTPPEIIDTDGLNDGETYSDEITITANVTDDQSDIYEVNLDVENENFTERYYFNTEITNYIYKTYCHCYATLELDTANIYDGLYEVTIEAEDDRGYITTETFSVRFENGYIYVPSDGDGDDDDDDRVSPGFEGLGLILTLIVVAGLVKRRK